MWSWLGGEGLRFAIGGGAVLGVVLLVRLTRGNGMAASVLRWLALTILISGGTVAGLLWLLGWPRFPATRDFTVSQLLELLKIVLAVVAGFGGVVLLAMNYRRQRTAEAEHELAFERGRRETEQAYNERFGAASEQLAHESAAVRIAGVYAMAGLADDWVSNRQVCVEVLCGYLRLAPEEVDTYETEVRETVLRVIRERLRDRFRLSWCALNFDFSDVEFTDADFSGLHFSGEVVFDRARFSGSLASFEGTEFHGTLSCHGTTFDADRVTFRGARFYQARTEFVATEFTSGTVDFRSSRVEGGTLDFFRARFPGDSVDFSDGEVSPGIIRFDQCEFALGRLGLQVETGGKAPEFIDSLWEARSPGKIMITRCRFDGGILDFGYAASWHPTIWLLDSELSDVTITVDDEEPARPWIDARRLRLTGTELPERHVRQPRVP